MAAKQPFCWKGNKYEAILVATMRMKDFDLTNILALGFKGVSMM